MCTVYIRCGKRTFDLLVTILAIVALSPVSALVAFAAATRLGWPVLFRQQRVGRDGHPFMLYKFRTMTEQRDSKGMLLPDDQRLTPFGKWLRSVSLDELPQLWNVLRGDMSLVGPRPLFARYFSRYTPYQARRLDVRPGITGWAQVNGRNAISWDEKFQLDVWYVDNVCLRLDLKILLLTVWRLFVPRGVSAEGHVTMPEFLGSSVVRNESAVGSCGGPQNQPDSNPQNNSPVN